MSRETFLEAVQPVLDHLAGADAADPGLAARLGRELPLTGPVVQRLRDAARAGIEDGWLCPREAGGIQFGRAVKPSAESHGYSVDAVVMDRVVGPKHTHPNGEIDLCFTEEGEARFDGHPEGWVVFGPESTHRPTVKDGRMLILYFLPDGAIQFHR